MPQVADHLAEVTGFRDRDVLDTALVSVLRDLLRPLVVTVCHHVGDGAQQRWLVRARLAEGDVAASADSVWAELDELPKLEAFPARLECLRKQEPVEVPGVTHITCFPLLTDLDAVGCWRSKVAATSTPTNCARSAACCACIATCRACSTTASATC